MKLKKEAFVLGFSCFILVMSIFLQIKAVKNSKTQVAKTTAEAELRDSVMRYQEKYDNRYKKLQEENEKLDMLIKNASDKTSNEGNYPEELKKLNTKLGFSDMQGEGIIITVQDGSKESVKTGIFNYWFLVHDGDLIQIVNLLKAGGAEAISINGERIVGSTAISCAGNIIKINGKKIGTPFVIKSIGLTEKLYGMVTVTSDYLKNMELQGVKVNIEKKDNIKIEKYNGVYSFNYAKSE